LFQESSELKKRSVNGKNPAAQGFPAVSGHLEGKPLLLLRFSLSIWLATPLRLHNSRNVRPTLSTPK
jgi:hypothetical protein